MKQVRGPAVCNLVERLVQAEAAAAEAYARQDMKAQNRWADRRHEAVQELLARGEPGRAALEELLQHELPLVRLAAATNVFDWAPDRAASVLEELLAWAYVQKDSKHPGLRPMVASTVLGDVKILLARHYGIRPREVVRRVLGIEEDPRPWLHGPSDFIIKIFWRGSEIQIGVPSEARFLHEKAFLDALTGAGQSETYPPSYSLNDSQYDAYLELINELNRQS